MQPEQISTLPADCLEKRWTSYIRDGSTENARGYGTRPKPPIRNRFAPPPI